MYLRSGSFNGWLVVVGAVMMTAQKVMTDRIEAEATWCSIPVNL